MTHLAGKPALDVQAGAPNNGRGQDNVGVVKKMQVGRDTYPYISPQAARRWLRDSFPADEPISPVLREGTGIFDQFTGLLCGEVRQPEGRSGETQRLPTAGAHCHSPRSPESRVCDSGGLVWCGRGSDGFGLGRPRPAARFIAASGAGSHLAAIRSAVSFRPASTSADSCVVSSMPSAQAAHRALRQGSRACGYLPRNALNARSAAKA